MSPLQAVTPGHATTDYNQITTNWNQFDHYEPFRKVYPTLPQVAMKLILVPKKKAMTEQDVKRLQSLEGYSDPAGVVYWAGKELDQYLTARLQDKIKNIQAALQ